MQKALHHRCFFIRVDFIKHMKVTAQPCFHQTSRFSPSSSHYKKIFTCQVQLQLCSCTPSNSSLSLYKMQTPFPFPISLYTEMNIALLFLHINDFPVSICRIHLPLETSAELLVFYKRVSCCFPHYSLPFCKGEQIVTYVCHSSNHKFTLQCVRINCD